MPSCSFCDVPAKLILPCVSGTESPAYQFKATVTYDYGYVSLLCDTEYKTKINESLPSFESAVAGICPGISWDISVISSGVGKGSTEASFRLYTTQKSLASPIFSIIFKQK